MNEVIAGVEIPDAALVRRATAVVRDATDYSLFNHCRRVYLWGTLLGRRRGLVVDPELLYVAAMFHDVGLTARYGRSEHFEIDGANAARDFLLRNGFASAKDARIVWLAIALHTPPGAADHVEPEIALVSAGIDSDVRGRHLDALTSDEIRDVTAAHPAATTVGHRTGSAHRCNLVPGWSEPGGDATAPPRRRCVDTWPGPTALLGAFIGRWDAAITYPSASPAGFPECAR